MNYCQRIYNNAEWFVPILSIASIVIIIIVTVWYIWMMRGKYWDKLYENMLQLGIFDIDEPQFVDKLMLRYIKRQNNKIKKPNAFDKKLHPTISHVSVAQRHYTVPTSIGTELKRMLKRQHEYGNNYILFQITNKVFGVASVVFSILGLLGSQFPITTFISMNLWLNPFLTFFSIVFVIIALYLSPTTRVAQYITSWKMLDDKINKAISQLEQYDLLNTEYEKYLGKNAYKSDIVAKIIQAKASELAKTLTAAEQNLSSDGE